MSKLIDLLRMIKSHAHRFHFHIGRPCRVLIVDDDFSIRQFAERVLAEAGYFTSSASDGPEALKSFQNNGPFDVLLTDFDMPQMDGAELARQVRSAEPSVKVLYLTGYSDALFDKKFTKLWSDEAFLEKPCTADSLLEAVSVLLHRNLADLAESG
jgi:two-component system cell cycle sensor histidine kinase/response regulator CckA